MKTKTETEAIKSGIVKVKNNYTYPVAADMVLLK